MDKSFRRAFIQTTQIYSDFYTQYNAIRKSLHIDLNDSSFWSVSSLAELISAIMFEILI